MAMKKIIFYIGADNVDRMVDRVAVINIVGSVWDAYTLVPTVGVWKGEQENSLMVIVWSDKEEWTSVVVARRLCIVLKQESVGLEFDGDFRLVSAPIHLMEAKKKERCVDGHRHPSVAIIECVENRIEAGLLRWWLHCRMRDGTYRLFADIDEESYRQLCEEEAEYELMSLGIEPEWL